MDVCPCLTFCMFTQATTQDGNHLRPSLKNRQWRGDLKSKLRGQLLDIHPLPNNLVPQFIRNVVGPMSPNPLAATAGSGAYRKGLGDVETCMRPAHPSGWSSPSACKKMLMVSGSLKSSAVTKARMRKRCALIMRRRTLILRATDNHAEKVRPHHEKTDAHFKGH